MTRAADLFTPTVVTYAISAAWELGLLDELQQRQSVDPEVFAKEHGLHAPSVHAILTALGCGDVVEVGADGSASKGEAFDEVFTAKGFFYWLTRGCGELFATMPTIVPQAARQGGFVHRDLRAVGVACRDLGYNFFDPPFFALLEELEFRTIADLGCGSGERLIQAMDLEGASSAVGIDISANALQLAHEAIHEAGLDDRIALVRADARDLPESKAFEEVDLLTCFLMGHDFWPRESCVASLQAARRAFPNVRNFILCDTYRSEVLPSGEAPIFTPGFEVAHALMGAYLPTLEEWEGVFEDGGWRLAERRDIAVPPYSAMFVLQPL